MALFHFVEPKIWGVYEKDFALMQREMWNKEQDVQPTQSSLLSYH